MKSRSKSVNETFVDEIRELKQRILALQLELLKAKHESDHRIQLAFRSGMKRGVEVAQQLEDRDRNEEL